MPGGLGLGRLGSMPLGGAEITVQALVDRPSAHVFRSAGLQFRSAATGLYVGNWTDISSYVKRWGTLEQAVDDVRFNNFTDRGVTLIVNNDNGAFNHHSNPSSLFFGYLHRYRTLLRIQAGYYDTDLSTEYPADPTLGIFILDQEISIKSSSNDVYLRGSSLKSVFSEVRATDIAGIYNSAMTAQTIVQRIRDHTDGAGLTVFRQFITSTSWTIGATTNNYVITTDLAQNMNAWDLMETLAESEGFVVTITRTGGIEFVSRAARQASSQFQFYGQNFPRPSVIEIAEHKESWDKYFNFFRLKYLAADTTTSYVTAGTSTAVNATNASWVFGARVYEFENLFPNNTATAQAIVNNLFSISAATTTSVPVEISFEATFVPGLNVLDRVAISYRSYELANNSLWDVMVWDTDRWGQEGVNFDLNSSPAFLTAVRTDLDGLKTTFTARAI